ncbi:tyrosine recombinase XerS [Paenibacillaceae sp. P-4]|uniref:tyrosine recombinase XerS n=1 Tax=Paenibacillaceae bacterium P-4 TaxID=3160969 RepID=UPI0032E8069D
MDKQTKLHYMKRIDEKLSDLPWYVTEYIDSRKRKLSHTTLLNYTHDFIIFFDWMVTDCFVDDHRKNVSLDALEKLTVRDIENFLTYLEYQTGNSRITINRKISALKSLFDYLQNKAETTDLKPYLLRNVMAKVELNSVKESQETVANRIGGTLLRDDDFDSFREFVSHGYGQKYKDNKRMHRFHQHNRERDTAIISLILGSGLRLSEVAGCNLEDLDLKNNLIRVTRKGNKEQFVYFSDQAFNDIMEYIKIREARYKPGKSDPFLFLPADVGRKGKSRRFTQRSIEKIVEKYAKSYGKSSLSVHTLRHSFATRYHKENNDVPKLRNQLGHSSIQTTMIYTHLTNDEMKEAINRMDN